MRDGRSSWCKDCHRAATRRWRAEHGAEADERRERAAAERAEQQAAGSRAIRETQAQEWRPSEARRR
jgi:hypothetical protein